MAIDEAGATYGVVLEDDELELLKSVLQHATVKALFSADREMIDDILVALVDAVEMDDEDEDDDSNDDEEGEA